MTEPAPAQRGLAGKAGRFIGVGLVNTVIDMAVFALLVTLSVKPLTANIGAWAVAVTFSYFVNSRWTFDRSDKISGKNSFVRFVSLGALISLGVSSGAIAALSGTIGLWPAKILGVIVAAVLNFVAARWSIENRIV